jgi:hypothetical protein
VSWTDVQPSPFAYTVAFNPAGWTIYSFNVLSPLLNNMSNYRMSPL